MVQRPENPFSSRFTRPGVLPFLLPIDQEPASWSDRSRTVGPPNQRDLLQAGPHHTSDINPETSEWFSGLLAKLRSHPRTAIIGPHGSGKTTLLKIIVQQLEEEFGKRLAQVTLKIGEPHAELWAEVNRLLAEEKNGLRSDDQQFTTEISRESNNDSVRPLVDLREPPKAVLIIDGFEQLGWIGRIQLAWHLHYRHMLLIVTAHHAPHGFTVAADLRGNEAVARRLTNWLIRDFPELSSRIDQEFATFWSQSKGNLRDLWSILYDWFENRLQSANPS